MVDAVTHLEKVITGEVSAVTHLEKVIAGETSAVTYTEKVIAGEAPPITHLQRVIAGVESPVTHLEHVWAGGTPTPTEHEYTGAVPYTFTADGTPLLDWYIKGNMSQNGTPTPSSPIQPSECGERAANSFNINGTYTTQENNSVSNNQINARCAGSNESYMWFDDTILSGTYKLSLQFNGDLRNVRILCSKAFSGGTYNSYYGGWYVSLDNGEITITVSEDFKIGFNFIGDAGATGTVYNIMFSTDTNADYEPYGYKIPISSGGVTTNIYLGSTQTVREICKLVLTGQENDWIYQSDYTRFLLTVSDVKQFVVRTAPMYSTHYQVIDDGRPIADVPNNSVYFNNQYLCITTSDYTSTTDFKAFLAAQYAAGTPVTVWYVLSSATTGIVNEPLRKIGDYADTLTATQAGVSIPTNNGSTTIDIDTTLKPSEVYIKYMG